MKSDMWEDGVCEGDDSDTEQGQRDWSRMHQNLTQDGYREGLSQGKELSTQDGFNAGYKTASLTASKLSYYRGVLLGMKSYTETTAEVNSETSQKINNLIEKISATEKQFILSKGEDSLITKESLVDDSLGNDAKSNDSCQTTCDCDRKTEGPRSADCVNCQLVQIREQCCAIQRTLGISGSSKAS